MVNLALQKAVSELSLAEKVELRDYIDVSLGSHGARLTQQQVEVVRGRAGDLDANPALGLPWADLNAELMAEFG